MSTTPRRAPSAGAWSPPNAGFVPDTLHFPAGAAAALWDVWPIAVADGLDEAAHAYGLLLDRATLAWNPPRWQLPETARRGDAALWWRLATDATARARLAHARHALTRAGQDAQWWAHERHAALDARHLELAATPPRALDDRTLATLVAALAAQYAASVRLTARLFAGATLAVGAYLRRGQNHAGADPAALAAALPAPALPLTAAQARRLLAGRPGPAIDPDTLPGLRLSDGCDLASPCLDELPELLVALAQACAQAPDGPDWRARGAALADAVAPRHYRAFVDCWALAGTLMAAHAQALASGPATAGGLLRRALLAGGERLVARGLGAPEAVFDASPEAVVAALCGGPLPAPLRPPAAAPAPVRADPSGHAHLPRGAREAMADFRAGLAAWYGPAARAAPHGLALGVCTSQAGTARGPLRFAAGSAALWSQPPGCVVVTDALSPTVPVLPPGIAALLIRAGGVLSVGVRAGRRAGVPVVAGVGAALDALEPGTVVIVDSHTGAVRADPPR